MLADGLLHRGHPLLRRVLRARHADDAEALRQQPSHGERVERGEELALGEVAGRAEDDERARVCATPQPQPLRERVLGRRAHRGS